jgi:hypothetical protein
MEPAKLQSPKSALLLKPGFELDVFIYRYIFDGILEVVSSSAGQRLERPIPSFSRRADAAKSLLIKMAMENIGVSFEFTLGDFGAQAKGCGYITADNPPMAWQLRMDDYVSYGLTMEEAICKMSITLRSSEDA